MSSIGQWCWWCIIVKWCCHPSGTVGKTVPEAVIRYIRSPTPHRGRIICRRRTGHNRDWCGKGIVYPVKIQIINTKISKIFISQESRRSFSLVIIGLIKCSCCKARTVSYRYSVYLQGIPCLRLIISTAQSKNVAALPGRQSNAAGPAFGSEWERQIIRAYHNALDLEGVTG